MSDEVFHDVAYKARKREHLLAGIDEFLDAVTVLPPGEWDPSIRIEPPQQVPSQVRYSKAKFVDTASKKYNVSILEIFVQKCVVNKVFPKTRTFDFLKFLKYF